MSSKKIFKYCRKELIQLLYLQYLKKKIKEQLC